jgi:hypothetical protein
VLGWVLSGSVVYRVAVARLQLRLEGKRETRGAVRVRVRSSHIQRRALREMACLADDVLVVVVEARHPRQRLETRGQQSQVASRSEGCSARCWGYKLQASRLLGNAGSSTRLLLALSLDQMSAMPPFTRLGWGALLEARALTAAGLEPRRMIMALARPAPLQATKARRVEPERALCKPEAASGPRLDAVVSGRSPISHDLDLDVQLQQPSPACAALCSPSCSVPPACAFHRMPKPEPRTAKRATAVLNERSTLRPCADPSDSRSRRVALPLRPARNQRRSLEPAVETT